MPKENKVQERIFKELRLRGWHVENFHGNLHQSGIPDGRAWHPEHGSRWIEVKRPDAWEFTPDQLIVFPRMIEARDWIWFLSGPQDILKLKHTPPEPDKYARALCILTGLQPWWTE